MAVSRIPRRFAVLLSALLLLTACGDEGGSIAAAPGSPGSPASPGSGEDAGSEGNLTSGCVEDYEEGRDYFPSKVAFSHTTNVSVEYADTYKVVTVTPLRAPDATPVRYVLHQCGTPAPDLEAAAREEAEGGAETDLSGAQVIEVPVAEVVTLTTSNLPHFDAIGMVDRLVGVGTPDFVTTESVRARIEEGAVTGFADSTGAADLEALIAAGPDLLVMDGFGDTVLEEVQRFVDAGIPTVLNADFVEGDLLGRAEWLKLTSLFLNAEAEAEAAYDEIATAYEEIEAEAAASSRRPSVFANTPFEGTWYIPGGDSYFAHAVEDAGGAYVLADDPSQSTLQLDFETVLDRAADADVWLQAGSVHGTLDDLLATDARFGEFKAFRDGEVYAYDAWTSPGGGYAVFEIAYTRADWFLADLVKILHPELLPDHELRFFGQVPAAGDGAAGEPSERGTAHEDHG